MKQLMMSEKRKHTFSVLVENQPGVLVRISSLFSRRSFNIDSLAVGETENPAIARITIVVTVDDAKAEQIIKQLNKLVHTIKIVEQESSSSVSRQLLLLKVNINNQNYAKVTEVANLFRVKVIDVDKDSVVIEATGTTEKLAALLNILKQFGIKEMVQSGVVAIGRGAKVMQIKNK